MMMTMMMMQIVKVSHICHRTIVIVVMMEGLLTYVVDIVSFNCLKCRANYNATSNNMKLVHWPSIDELLPLV